MASLRSTNNRDENFTEPLGAGRNKELVVDQGWLQHLLPPCPGSGGARSTVGLPEKKPSGLSVKPVDSQGITGKSSTRGTCASPNECHRTMSSSSRDLSAAVHAGRPPAATPPRLCTV